MWINRKSVFEWNGNEYVEVYSDKYRYEGEVVLAQGEGPWAGNTDFFNWLSTEHPDLGMEGWNEKTPQEKFEFYKAFQTSTATPQAEFKPPAFFTWLSEQLGKEITAEEFTNLPLETQNMWDSKWKEHKEKTMSEDKPYIEDEVVSDDGVESTEPRRVGEQYIDSAGNLWATYEEAYASNVRIGQAEAQRAERVGDFEKRFDEYERLIEEGSAEEKELAQRMSARMRGQLERRIEDSILATGGEVPEGFEERLAESSTRQLLDITSDIEQRRIAQLTGAKQYEIGTDMNLEQIGLQEQGLEQQMTQFLAAQAQRESQFQSGLGLQQAELALQRQLGLGQLNLSRDQLAEQRRQFNVGLDYQLTPEEQMKAALWGSIGEGVGTLGSFVLSKLGQK